MGSARRPNLTAALLALLLAALALQDAAAAPAAWRIAGKNGGEVALLGSVHVLRAADYPLPPLVDELTARAETLVMELDLDDLDPTALQATTLKMAMLPTGKTLHDVLPKDVYELAAARAKALGVDLVLLDRFEPWLVAVTLLDLGMRRLGFESERGLEHYLVDQSRTNGKEIVGLETLESQLKIFDDLSPAEQLSLLEQTLQELDDGIGVMAELATAWRDGKLDLLTQRLSADFDDFPGLYDTLVTNRNKAWVTSLERYLRDGHRYLVVVGALHLTGRNNVIGMLEARGFKVERVN